MTFQTYFLIIHAILFIQMIYKVDEPILAGRLKWRPTFEPKMVMKETENYLLYNLESQLWAIGCVEIFSFIWWPTSSHYQLFTFVL
jgi:hypothetical protein